LAQAKLALINGGLLGTPDELTEAPVLPFVCFKKLRISGGSDGLAASEGEQHCYVALSFKVMV
jgi:hypothetical protein